jgi:hypothetical protein
MYMSLMFKSKVIAFLYIFISMCIVCILDAITDGIISHFRGDKVGYELWLVVIAEKFFAFFVMCAAASMLINGLLRRWEVVKKD